MTIFIALFPYRRGERWAWWALLLSLGAGSALSLIRVWLLTSRAGAGQALVVLVWLLLALAIGGPRMLAGPSPESSNAK